MYIASDKLYLIDLVLLLLMFLSFCQQMFSKKFNMYGILSALSLAAYIAIHTVQSGINIFVLVLFIASILLIIAELFVPGGILGVFGTITLIYSIIEVNNESYTITFIIIISFIVSSIWCFINIYLFKNKFLFLNKLVLNEKITTDAGYVAKESDLTLINKELIAFTDLRPSGIAIFENEKYDVVTEGEFVEKGNKLIVIKVEGMRIIVRKK
ncbi:MULTISPECIES: NfeD family protein [unclassified Gemella]|uniref:NfeD family protein n=1 Tax=unclassified Gemella TaxID=2624949 RepID=UPI001C04A339|nr:MULTISPECIES: NfeD family protein [unclassified Gemella]MBU0278106.1 serine peptidase [Gemella sp. zg-1178]QWQ38368.1 serine peptidase [Gemella sp. zg-570]